MRTASRSLVLVALAVVSIGAAVSEEAETAFAALLARDEPFVTVPQKTFDALGWDLPDGGAHVRKLAEVAPLGAFDPRALEPLPADQTGYHATWHVVRYRRYGVDWDITGLYLQPVHPEPGLPTFVQIHGGSHNFYQFFIAGNQPGFGQYLAQRMPVLLVTIPGNYRPGGWPMPPDQRQPSYVLDRDLPAAEVSARHAMFTFSLIADGVARLVEEVTKGPVVISGHSTGGEIQFMLKDRLRDRLLGRSYGWGTGGPASQRREWADGSAAEHNRTGQVRYRPVTEVRARGAEGYTSGYIGPYNMFLDRQSTNVYEWYFRIISNPGLLLDTAKRLVAEEGGRKPLFKQHLQDIEHNGQTEVRDQMVASLREAIAKSGLPTNPDEVARDYFENARVDMSGYHRMVWVSSMLDEGHWDPDPAKARELAVANAFRRVNPDATIRVAVYDSLMTHLGYYERPKQLAGGAYVAARWLFEDVAGPR